MTLLWIVQPLLDSGSRDATIQHRMTDNLSFLANYTWSHCISVGGALGDIAAPSFQNSPNPVWIAPTAAIVRHIFNTTVVASSHLILVATPPHNYIGMDAALSCSFPVYERLAFTIHLEAINVLNHPNFSKVSAA